LETLIGGIQPSMKRWLTAVAMASTGLLAAVSAGTASEPEAGAPEAAAPVTEFTGTCRYEGFVEFDDPLGAIPELNHMTLEASGTCTGWLDGRYVEGARAEWRAEADGLMSCAEGLLSGPGRMIVDGERISLTFTESRATGVGDLLFTGDAGGALHGVGATSDEVAEAIERCSEGDGTLSRVRVFAYLSGSISG
jgi:hypothetical protein